MANEKLLQLIAEVKAKQAALAAAQNPAAILHPHTLSAEELVEQAVRDADPNAFTWNKEQRRGIELAVTGKSFCLIGAAGTGKTTTEREIVRRLIVDGKVEPLNTSTKYLVQGVPGIVLTSFTRRAVRNMRKVVSEEMKQHCITLHKLLEYEPVFYEVWDNEAQKMKNTMRFEPMKNRDNRLPEELKCVIIDESSMVSTDLFQKLLEALPNVANVQFIFVGDLHQLPPVYGQAILGFKLLDLETVELTQIYRQAQQSPIIALAHRMKNGEDIPLASANETVKTEQGTVTLRPWKKPLSDFDAALTAGAFLKKLITEGDYNEEEDIILCPQEKVKNTAFGTNEFNRIVAQALGDKRRATVFEVIAGYEKHYLAVGDRILVGREDAIIKAINKNSKYWGGKRPVAPSTELDRWGNYRTKVTQETPTDDADIDALLDSFALEPSLKEEDKKQEASHEILVELLDSGVEETISTAGELNATQFAYCLTVHKSQGSEWRRVFFLTHQSHVVMWNRELLYTAITRAREELYVICEPDRAGKRGTLWKAAKSPRIKGDTLAEKAEYFKGKQAEYESKYEQLTVAKSGRRAYKRVTESEKPIILAPAPEPVKLIRLCEFVPQSFKDRAEAALTSFWNHAYDIWGEAKIGPFSTISYNLQRGNIVGLARLNTNEIVLNPLWCILAERPGMENLAREMLHETIGHEVAHLVVWNYARERGHESGWVMAMKLLNLKPDVYADGLPSWAESMKGLIRELELELQSKGADTSHDWVGTSHDEA